MSPLESFSNFILNTLQGELPGIRAHRLMLPLQSEDAEARIKPSVAPINAKKSAVLIGLHSKTDSDDISVILTLRSNSLRSHKGQISLPGGRIEQNETEEESALREAYEEIGLEKQKVEIIGKFSTIYVPPSNNVIVPVVGIINNDSLNLTRQPEEVEEIFHVSLKNLNRDSVKIGVRDSSSGLKFKAPYWDIHPIVPLWGATAMILSELVMIYEQWQNSINKLFLSKAL